MSAEIPGAESQIQFAEEFLRQNPMLEISVNTRSAKFMVGILGQAEWLHGEGNIDNVDYQSAEIITDKWIDAVNIQSGGGKKAQKQIYVPLSREQLGSLNRIKEAIRGKCGLSLEMKFALTDSFQDIESGYNFELKRINRTPFAQKLRTLIGI